MDNEENKVGEGHAGIIKTANGRNEIEREEEGKEVRERVL